MERLGALSVVGEQDFVLGQRLDDGGLNCRANRSGARASSVHSTISVIDGLAEYLRDGYAYRAAEVREAIGAATGALLARHLYQRRSSGEPIRAEFTRLHHPARWHFDVLRGSMCSAAPGQRTTTGSTPPWRAPPPPAFRCSLVRAAQYPGQVQLAYPRAGEPNRWITLRALRVLAWAGS